MASDASPNTIRCAYVVFVWFICCVETCGYSKRGRQIMALEEREYICQNCRERDRAVYSVRYMAGLCWLCWLSVRHEYAVFMSRRKAGRA